MNLGDTLYVDRLQNRIEELLAENLMAQHQNMELGTEIENGANAHAHMQEEIRRLKDENEELKDELKLKGRYSPYPLHTMSMFLVNEQMKNKKLKAENDLLLLTITTRAKHSACIVPLSFAAPKKSGD